MLSYLSSVVKLWGRSLSLMSRIKNETAPTWTWHKTAKNLLVGPLNFHELSVGSSSTKTVLIFTKKFLSLFHTWSTLFSAHTLSANLIVNNWPIIGELTRCSMFFESKRILHFLIVCVFPKTSSSLSRCDEVSNKLHCSFESAGSTRTIKMSIKHEPSRQNKNKKMLFVGLIINSCVYLFLTKYYATNNDS